VDNVDTYHVQVKHKLYKSSNKKLPLLDKRLHFQIDYYGPGEDFPVTIDKDFIAEFSGTIVGLVIGSGAVAAGTVIGTTAIGLTTITIGFPALIAGVVLGGIAYFAFKAAGYAFGKRLEENIFSTPYKRIRFWWDDKS
jgi:hypothetical protein